MIHEPLPTGEGSFFTSAERDLKWVLIRFFIIFAS